MRTTARTARRLEVWMRVKDPAALRRKRVRRGYTQEDLARLARCTQQYISALERGVDKDCSERIAGRICQYLDVDVEELFATHETVVMPTVTTASRVTSRAS